LVDPRVLADPLCVPGGASDPFVGRRGLVRLLGLLLFGAEGPCSGIRSLLARRLLPGLKDARELLVYAG
jgi:hypothetical protein